MQDLVRLRTVAHLQRREEDTRSGRQRTTEGAARVEAKLALPLQRNFHRRMNDEQKLIRTFVVGRTD